MLDFEQFPLVLTNPQCVFVRNELTWHSMSGWGSGWAAVKSLHIKAYSIRIFFRPETKHMQLREGLKNKWRGYCAVQIVILYKNYF